MVEYKLSDYLSDCPKPWRKFIEHCGQHCPRDQAIECYVDQVLRDRYNCTIIDDDDYAHFDDVEHYTLFLIEWS